MLRFDGKFALGADDSTFAEPRTVGLWTKADASSRFDGLRVRPQR